LWGFFSAQTPKLLGAYGARLAPPETQRILENLSIGAGLPKPKLFVIGIAAPNAFAVGGDPAHSIIGVTQGLLDLLDHRELEGVLAHELSHIGNRDTRLNATVAALSLFLQLPRILRQRRVSIEEQTRLGAVPSPVNPFGVILLVLLSPVFLYFFLVAPLVAALIRSAISRDREFLADADAALLTRYPEGLIRALAKIQGAGSRVGASPAVAHFYFAGAVAPETALFTTHPPVEQRIARLAEIEGGVPAAVIEAAVEDGARFAREHLPAAQAALAEPAVQDELSVVNMGNVMGGVHRLVGSPATLYDRPNVHSAVLAQIPVGSLLVVFDDPGPFRQVLTADRTFGYVPLPVHLEAVDMLPAELLEPAAPAPLRQP
jgi:heat shock protein HtpX